MQKPKNIKRDFIISRNENKNKIANLLSFKDKLYEDKINKINKKRILKKKEIILQEMEIYIMEKEQL